MYLKPGDPAPKDPEQDYVYVNTQNDAEFWNELVRQNGAICRDRIHRNCQFYKDLGKHPECVGTKDDH